MLRISREDIPSEYIVEDYPVKDRFIKLPIIPYLKLLPSPMGHNHTVYDDINAPQIALINAVNCPKYRFICGALSRRLGKTFISNVIGQMVTLIPKCNVLIISPNYNLSSISFDLQRTLITQFDLEIERNNLKDRIIELSNGSTIRMGSLSTVDSTVGRSYDLIIFDEAALGDGEEAFNIALRPTLDKPNSKAIFISTPRGKNNWFSKFFQRGFDPKFPEWVSIHADYLENTRSSASDIAEAKRTMSRNQFEQEYMANFNVYEGLIFELVQANIVEYEPGPNDELIAGMDPGYRDPTAFVVIAYNPDTEVFHIIDEYMEDEKTTNKIVAALRPIIAKYNLETIFIDPAAAQLAADLAYIYDIPSIKAKKDLLPGIAFVQSLLDNNRLKVAPHCGLTLVALDQYQWDPRETLQKEKPDHKHSHIPDAIRYALYTFTT